MTHLNLKSWSALDFNGSAWRSLRLHAKIGLPLTTIHHQTHKDKMSTPDLPYGVLHVARNRGLKEYSMWSLFQAIWSTPYGSFLVSYGVLQDSPTRSNSFAIWSTPYGYFMMPHGALHVAEKCFILNNVYC